MEKGVGFYLSVLLVFAGIFVLSFVGLKFTGFATFNQPGEVNFNMTDSVFENITLEGNSLVVEENQTTGEYLSGFFGNGNMTQWNNLTLNGSENLLIEVRVCDSTENCSADFESVNLNDVNLTGNYFQYKAFFGTNSTTLEAINIDYTVLPEETAEITLSITQPSGTIETQSGIILDFTATEAENCWYSLDGGVTNTTLENCTSTTFSVDSDGTYTLDLYADNSEEKFAHESSEFIVDTQTEEENQEEAEEETVPEPTIETTLEPQIPQLSFSGLGKLSVHPNKTKESTVSVSTDLEATACSLVGRGERASWISSNEEKTISAGSNQNFAFSVSIPEETEEGDYTIELLLRCSNTGGVTNLMLGVVEEKIKFELIDARRTRDDRVRVHYFLTELIGEDQDVEVLFQLINQNKEVISEVNVNRSLDANETDDFRTNIEINESSIPVVLNETTNETIESEFELIVRLNSQIYSSIIEEKIMLGAPISGFSVFTEDLFEARNLVTLGLLIAGLAGAFIAVRVYRRKFHK